MGFEHVAVCGAMIASTKIIAPLGTISIAANSIAVTAESICYMPGYGIASAATTLVGQSIGAGRDKLAKSFANLSVLLGCGIMSVMAVIMYFICPSIFNMLTPDQDVRLLATNVLRIELFAEPLFGVSIVASGALRGAGDTLIPSILNLISIWGVRIVLSLLLVSRFGLEGVWLAMCLELCVRGILMLGRMKLRLGRG
jgi:Na+-driven multidrug efflux pump